MLYRTTEINIFPKYNFQGKKVIVIAMSPKHSFVLITEKNNSNFY